MAWLLGGIVALAAVMCFASRMGWVNFSNKSRGTGGPVLGAVDEIFAPSRHEAAIERDRQATLPAPAPLAGDGDRGVYAGRIRIAVNGSDGDSGRQRVSRS